MRALSGACCCGYTSTVQLLLDAGADPTIPEGDRSPLNITANGGHQEIVALLTHAIAEPERSRYLHKARCLVDACYEIRKAQSDNRSLPQAQQRQRMVDAAREWLKGRVGRGEPLPRVQVNEHEDEGDEEEECEKRRGVLAYALGMEGGARGEGLPREVFVELLEMLVPAWDEARRPAV